MNFIFDVDGTLTPSRGIIDHNFRALFNSFCLVNDVYLVTGSDRPKTIEQIGEGTYNLCKRVYNCSGNDVWEKDKNIHRNDITLPDDLLTELDYYLTKSDYPYQFGNHLEIRPGLANFSLLGRHANQDQRKEYVKWDKNSYQRKDVASILNSHFSDFQFEVAGEIGIDITEVGKGKEQIVKDFDGPITFFGDKTQKGGNDNGIANAISMRGLPNMVYQVDDWTHTMNILKEKYSL